MGKILGLKGMNRKKIRYLIERLVIVSMFAKFKNMKNQLFKVNKSIFTLLLLLISFSIHAQKKQNLAMIQDQLDQMNLEFFKPTENSFKFSKLRTTEFFDYDTRIKARSNEMEVLIALHPDGEDEFSTYYPHLEFNRLLGNLTPNDDEQNVLVIGWREQKLKTKNADWGAEAYFTPREAVSRFPNAKLISFYKEGYGMVVMLYCFDKPDSVPQLLSFYDPLSQ